MTPEKKGSLTLGQAISRARQAGRRSTASFLERIAEGRGSHLPVADDVLSLARRLEGCRSPRRRKKIKARLFHEITGNQGNHSGRDSEGRKKKPKRRRVVRPGRRHRW